MLLSFIYSYSPCVLSFLSQRHGNSISVSDKNAISRTAVLCKFLECFYTFLYPHEVNIFQMKQQVYIS